MFTIEKSFFKTCKVKDRLDKFYFSTVGEIETYPKFCRVVKLVLILFHGQASVEREFNVNENMLQPNLQEKSLTSQRIIYDHMKANSLAPESIVITKQLRESARKARSKQRTDQEERQKKDLINACKSKMDSVSRDIKEVESKKIRLEKVEKSLKSDSEALLLKAADDAENAHRYAMVSAPPLKTRGPGKMGFKRRGEFTFFAK